MFFVDYFCFTYLAWQFFQGTLERYSVGVNVVFLDKFDTLKAWDPTLTLFCFKERRR